MSIPKLTKWSRQCPRCHQRSKQVATLDPLHVLKWHADVEHTCGAHISAPSNYFSPFPLSPPSTTMPPLPPPTRVTLPLYPSHLTAATVPTSFHLIISSNCSVPHAEASTHGS